MTFLTVFKTPKSDFLQMTQLYIFLYLTAPHFKVLQQNIQQLQQWVSQRYMKFNPFHWYMKFNLSHWYMKFNPSKCQVIQITKRKTPIPTHLEQYHLRSSYIWKNTLASPSLTIFLNIHIDNIIRKANQTVGFLLRNI